jgi:hypothetical protein
VTDPSGRISRFSRQEPLLFYQVAPQFVLTRLSAPRSRLTTCFPFFFLSENLVVPGIEPGPPNLTIQFKLVKYKHHNIDKYI